MEDARYIYGIIKNNGVGIDSEHTCPSEAADREVYTIPYQDISAVVSNSQFVDYEHTTKNIVAHQLLKHQKVIEGIMSEHTVIPMKLGTFAVNKDEVRQILTKGYPIINDIFNKIFDKIEIDVAASWNDFKSVLKEVGEEEEIKALKEKLLANPEGVTVNDQMKIGVMIKKAIDEKKEKYTREIENTLKSGSDNFKSHGLMDEKMLVNMAFLLSKGEQKDFDARVEELNSRFADRLNFRCIGPLPPYSFYTLEINKIEFEDMDWARKNLGLLNDFTTMDEIKSAHRRLAFSSHPDMLEVKEDFDDVNNAYKILLDYCKACEQGGQKERFSFKQEEFEENAILVKVKE